MSTETGKANIDWCLGEAAIDLDSALGNLERAERLARAADDERWRDVGRIMSRARSARQGISDVELDG